MIQEDDQLTRIENRVKSIEKKLDEQSTFSTVYFVYGVGAGVIALGVSAISIGLSSKIVGSIVSGTFGVCVGALLIFFAGLSAFRKPRQRGS